MLPIFLFAGKASKELTKVRKNKMRDKRIKRRNKYSQRNRCFCFLESGSFFKNFYVAPRIQSSIALTYLRFLSLTLHDLFSYRKNEQWKYLLVAFFPPLLALLTAQRKKGFLYFSHVHTRSLSVIVI